MGEKKNRLELIGLRLLSCWQKKCLLQYILLVYYTNDIICSVCVAANTWRALSWG